MIQGDFIVIGGTLVPGAGTAKTPLRGIYRTSDIYFQEHPDSLANRYLGKRPEIPHIPEETPSPTFIAVPAIAPDTSLFHSSYISPDLFGTIQGSLPRMAIKTNLLYGAATLTPNLAFEFATGPKSSIEISAGWNQWDYEGSYEGGNKKFNHYIVRPEYRWWFCERYNGHFIGAHAFFAQYNMSGYDVPLLFKKEYRYEGIAVGAGITYGYHLPLGKKWGAEFHVGLGAAYLNYKRFSCTYCSEVIDRPSKVYFGPTRAGISLVYLIK